MYKIQVNKALIRRHAINWGLFCVVNFLLGIIDPLPLLRQVFYIFLHAIIYSLTYYTIANIASRYLYYYKLYNYVIYIAIVFVLYIFCFYISDIVIYYLFFDYNRSFSIRLLWVLNISIYFIPIVILAYGFYENNVNLQIMQTQSEQSKLGVKREIQFLRNQFNHHISFNFLNYCYSFVHKNESAAKMIETYSDMLRYTLDTKPSVAVPLSYEVKYMEQFIQLQKLLSKNVQVQLIVLGTMSDKVILPRILITFVENAFKYGEMTNKDKPIKIVIDSQANGLDFLVENEKLKDIRLLSSTGIGQLNAKAHLDIFYKNKYELSIQDEMNRYSCRLHLKI
jgi:two-component system, LytTR family, sensor kinase